MLLGDIQKHVALAAADHDAYVEHLVQLSERESNGERISQQKEADTCKRRLDELDTLLQLLPAPPMRQAGVYRAVFSKASCFFAKRSPIGIEKSSFPP